jgi:hypothetical protein
VAKTPLKRRRAASPPPRKKPRASRPTRKNTSPYQSSDSFAARAGRIWPLLDPLTQDEEDGIRDCFDLADHRGAEQLLRDWTHISSEAVRRTLSDYMHAERTRLLFSGRSPQQRDTRLKKATAATTEAIQAVKKMVANWRSEGTDAVALALWTNDVIARLEQERETIRQSQRHSAQLLRHLRRHRSIKRGPPEEPETFRLKILAAYFRHHKWEVSSRERSLFTNVVLAVTTGGDPINHTRLKAVVQSRFTYQPPTT